MDSIRRFALVLAVACTALFAQFETAVVLGTVRDATQSVVPDAKVSLTNLDTGILATASTDSNGNYLFSNVKVGRYKVVAEKVGFASATAESFNVNVNARQRVDLQVAVGQVSESVQVSASVMAVESDSTERGQVVGQKQIIELPLNGRNYADLALLTTGVRRSDYAFANPPREGAFNVNGQRSVFNNFLMDGIDNNAYGTSNQGFSNQVVQATPDALAEFKVVTILPSAEYGRSSGAVINAAYRSGTNALHGSAWEFVRNTSLNATGFFKPSAGKPSLQRNQFGATVGGPLAKNRAFFFANYEGFRELQKATSFSSIPSLDDRRGLLPVAVRNPLTGEIFAANTPIPTAKMTAFAGKVLGELPAPTGPGRASNFNTLLRDKNFNDKFDLKLDAQINSKMTTFVRLSQRKSNYLQSPGIPGPSGGGGNGFIRALNQQLAAAYTFTVTPTSLFEARLGLSRTRAGKEPVALGSPDMRSAYGIIGLPSDPRIAGGLTGQEISGFTALGRQTTNPQWQHPFVVNPKFVYSTIRGRHWLKTGYEMQISHTEVQDVNPLYGRDIYGGTFSCIPTAPAATCTAAQVGTNAATYNLADFMFGTRTEYHLASLFVAQMRRRMHFLYVQDDFKVSKKLTLNLGVRYEYASPYWEADNQLTNLNLATGEIIKAKNGGIFDKALVNPDRNNFAPRIGVAYSLNGKTVIRSGYGVSYAHFNRVGSADLLSINGPQVVSALTTQTITQSNFIPTQNGYPAGLTSPERLNPLLANLAYLPVDTRTAYVQNWVFSLQREVAKNTVIDIAYLGNKSTHLIAIADYNQARPLTSSETLATSSLQSRRPYQKFGPVTVTWPHAFANYNAFQARFEHRGKSGVYLLNSFSYSKAIDNVGQSLEAQGSGGRPSPQNFYNLRADKAVADFDQTLNNTTTVMYTLPLGQGKKFAASAPGIVDAIIGGWQVSAIHNMWSGPPLNLSYNPAAAQQVSVSLSDFRGGISYRPNITGPVLTPASERTIDNYINPQTVVIPTDPTQPFGNAGRNLARGYALYQMDLGIGKSFRLPREGMSVQFRGEMFNAFNHSNFRNAGLNRSTAGFGQVRATFPARQIQFGLRLAF
ncbi:MAG: TonB-dependent receptor [Candidatus Solibacter usitatus]|nr:TonB-dependent receptor [Candidatus Solibacter usitatus]